MRGSPLFLRGVRGDPLRQDDQCGTRSRIVNCKEGLHEIKAVAGHRIRLKRHYVQRRRPSGCGRAAPRSISTARLQLHDIANIATLEGLLLDFATRHPAYPRGKLQEEDQSISTGASYVVVRVSSVLSAPMGAHSAEIPPTSWPGFTLNSAVHLLCDEDDPTGSADDGARGGSNSSLHARVIKAGD